MDTGVDVPQTAASTLSSTNVGTATAMYARPFFQLSSHISTLQLVQQQPPSSLHGVYNTSTRQHTYRYSSCRRHSTHISPRHSVVTGCIFPHCAVTGFPDFSFVFNGSTTGLSTNGRCANHLTPPVQNLADFSLVHILCILQIS